MNAIERYQKIDAQLGRAVNGVANARLLLDGIRDPKTAKRLKKNLRIIRDKICDAAINLENSYHKKQGGVL